MRILFFIAAWLSAVLLILPPTLYRYVFSAEASPGSDVPMGDIAAVEEQPEDSQNPPSEALVEESEPQQTQTPQTTAVSETQKAPLSTAPKKDAISAAKPQMTSNKTEENTSSDHYDSRVLLQITGESEAYTLPLRDYLIGVVMAEMPASFHAEALRAQAVAARSYLLYRRDRGYAIYDYGSSCTAHFTEQEGRAFFGDAYDAVLKTVTAAVDSTDGEVMYYNGAVICAAYHAMSYGYTADGADVWGGDTPYLTAVVTPEEESLSGLVQQETFDETTLCQMLQVARALPLVITQTASGRAASVVTASGDVFSGERFRALLRLRSTDISIVKQDANAVVMRVFGYGHGVGMSQYGADRYADDGWSYKEILLHYYPQTSLGLLS